MQHYKLLLHFKRTSEVAEKSKIMNSKHKKIIDVESSKHNFTLKLKESRKADQPLKSFPFQYSSKFNAPEPISSNHKDEF